MAVARPSLCEHITGCQSTMSFMTRRALWGFDFVAPIIGRSKLPQLPQPAARSQPFCAQDARKSFHCHLEFASTRHDRVRTHHATSSFAGQSMSTVIAIDVIVAFCRFVSPPSSVDGGCASIRRGRSLHPTNYQHNDCRSRVNDCTVRRPSPSVDAAAACRTMSTRTRVPINASRDRKNETSNAYPCSSSPATPVHGGLLDEWDPDMDLTDPL